MAYELKAIGTSGDQFRIWQYTTAVGVVYREPETDEWAVCPDYASPSSRFSSFDEVPADLRAASLEWHPSLHAITTALGITGA